MIRKYDASVERKEQVESTRKAEIATSTSRHPNSTTSDRPHRQRALKKRVQNIPQESAPIRPAPAPSAVVPAEEPYNAMQVVNNAWLNTPNSSKLRRLAELVMSAEYMETKMDMNRARKGTDNGVRPGKRTATHQLEDFEGVEVKRVYLVESQPESDAPPL